ncbi:hypothetical protein V5O48_002916 [Marasmius crinis-equi]|uniref:Uncharacterized protein n=1 Tax=Marasmius crinis-equi TaxID=585013 RepID=A0ABR3FUL4_9AGAR
MVAFAFLLVAFAYLVALPLQVLAIPSEFLLNPPGTAAFNGTKNTTEISQNNITPDCQSKCSTDTLRMLTNCTTGGCMCDDPTNTAITTCLDCLVDTTNSSSKISKPTRDALELEYVNTCKMNGRTITNAKVSGALASFDAKAGVVGTVIVAAILSVVV